MTDARVGVLRRVPAFARLDEATLRAVAESTSERPVAADEVLLRQGDPGDALWVLVEGTVEVVVQRRDGPAPLARLEAVQVLGEMALVTGGPRFADVVSRTPGRALVLPRAEFERVAAAHPDVVSVLTEIMAERLGRAAHDGLGDKVVEGYRILRPVGRGASAVVYEAEEPPTGRRVALKMLSHVFSRDAAAMDWFEREAQTLDHVAHEAIARCFGRHRAYGTCFLAIEYVDGPSAQEVVHRRGRMPVDDAMSVAGTVAAALAHVHDRGVVHGDLKPANVMLGRDGRVVLTDFGIASRVDTAGVCAGTVRVSGTPRFMAPEMFVGAPPSTATDLYALGCLLYELIEGRALFPAEDIGPLVLAKRRFRPPQPDEMRADVPAEVRSRIASLVAADPAERPGSAAELGLRAQPVRRETVEETIRLRA